MFTSPSVELVAALRSLLDGLRQRRFGPGGGLWARYWILDVAWRGETAPVIAALLSPEGFRGISILLLGLPEEAAEAEMLLAGFLPLGDSRAPYWLVRRPLTS